MIALKPIAKHAVDRALEKAERYRLLNEPWEAESICLDVLSVERDHPRALVCLLLSLTDQLQSGDASASVRARELLPRLPGEYERAYYAGIICERAAKRQLGQGQPGAGFEAFEYLTEAMQLYERAERLAPEGNDDAELRYNACVRLIERNHLSQRSGEGETEQPLE